MRNKLKISALVLLFLATLLIAENSYATLSDCKDPATGKPFPGISNKIVKCVQEVLNETLIRTGISKVRTELGNILSAMLTLYVVFFGYKVVLGGLSNLKGDFAKMLFTVLIVITLMKGTELENIVIILTKTQEALVNVVTSSIANSVPECNQTDVWMRIDCMATYMVGMESPGNYIPDPNKSVLLFVIMVGIMFTPIGLIAVFAGLASVVFMVFAFAQAVTIYITSMIAVIFLGLISPLIVPLLLFEKTKGIFDNWFNMLVAYVIQPALVMGFMAFMVHAMSYVYNGVGGSDNGLKSFYESAKNADESRMGYKTLVGTCNTTTTGGKCEELSELKGTSGGERTTAPVLPDYKFTTTGDQKIENDYRWKFLYTMFVSLILQLILFSFLVNIMNFASEIAGVGANNITGIGAIFNNAAGKIRSAAKMFAKGGG